MTAARRPGYRIHEADVGRTIRTTATVSAQAADRDFPGWSHPGAAGHLRPLAPGLAGVITAAESHGTRPFTRYAAAFADGTRAAGLRLGDDFEFTDGLAGPRMRHLP
jgi:hypothetical protein